MASDTLTSQQHKNIADLVQLSKAISLVIDIHTEGGLDIKVITDTIAFMAERRLAEENRLATRIMDEEENYPDQDIDDEDENPLYPESNRWIN